MKSIELNSWALEVLRRVERGLPIEDSRVEAKKGWPEPNIWTARQLAGHANAARGEHILWLIGADEKAAKITGAKHEELSNWFSQIKSAFESEVPALQDQIATYNGITVVALCFDTSRFPYVVVNPQHGKVKGEFELEVPWREGTAVRSATRNDLVLLLTPLTKVPKIEVLGGELRFIKAGPDTGNPHFDFSITCYVVQRADSPITIPFHKCSARLSAAVGVITAEFEVRLDSQRSKLQAKRLKVQRMSGIGVVAVPETRPHEGLPPAIEITEDEAVVKGSGKMIVEGDAPFLESSIQKWPEVLLSITLTDAISEAEALLNVRLAYKDAPTGMVWTYQCNPEARTGSAL